MAKYENLPGVFVTKMDGGVRVVQSAPSNLTLVVGTSPDGPTESVYLVSNTADAQAIFDPNGTGDGTLIRGMYEALNGGAPYVGLYRIGAKANFIDFIGPYRVEARYGGHNKLSEYNIFYYHPTNLLKIYDAATGTLVYSSDPADPVDIGAVKVSLSHPELADSSNFTAFNNASATPMSYSEYKTFVETNGLSASDISGTLTQGTNQIVISGTLEDVIKEGTLIKLTGGNTANSGTYEVLAITTSGSDYILTVRPNNYSTSRMLTNTDLSFQFVDNGGSDDTFADGKVLGMIYDGNDGLGLTLEEQYEELERAYFNLESIDMDYIIPMDTYMDATNVIGNGDTYSAPSVMDYLGEGAVEIINSTISFMWDHNHDGVADRLSVPSDIGLYGDNALTFITDKNKLASTIISGGTDTVSFHEMNMAYQLAKYLQSLSENDNEAHGFVGVMPPATLNRFSISEWVGRSPRYDVATGNIVANGTGLIGNKFMAGTVTRTPGFYLTDTGYVDGTPQTDANGHKIDIGKYISIVAHWITMSDAVNSTLYIASGAAFYGGFTASLPVNVAPTNKKLPNGALLAFSLHKRDLDALTAAHYVAFGRHAATNGIKVIDAPTAATNDSDWKRLVTVRIIADLIDAVRDVAEPYIGGIFNNAVRGSLEQEINSLITARQKAGYLNAGQATVTQTRAQAIAGEASVHMTLYVIGELRRINVTVALRA